MAEGVPLLRVYLGNWIEGSNPSLSAIFTLKMKRNCALVAQLDRVPGYEPGGRRFESSRARHIEEKGLPTVGLFFRPLNSPLTSKLSLLIISY